RSDLCPARFRPGLRLLRRAARSAGERGRPRRPAPSARGIPGEPPLRPEIALRQLPLEISPKPEPAFDNFLPGANAEALARVRSLAEGTLREAIVYLWGEPGSGRSHLLRAAARANPSLAIV